MDEETKFWAPSGNSILAYYRLFTSILVNKKQNNCDQDNRTTWTGSGQVAIDTKDVTHHWVVGSANLYFVAFFRYVFDCFVFLGFLLLSFLIKPKCDAWMVSWRAL